MKRGRILYNGESSGLACGCAFSLGNELLLTGFAALLFEVSFLEDCGTMELLVLSNDDVSDKGCFLCVLVVFGLLEVGLSPFGNTYSSRDT